MVPSQRRHAELKPHEAILPEPSFARDEYSEVANTKHSARIER